MQPKEKPEFFALMLALAERYEKTPTEAALELDWLALKELSLEQIRTGILKHLKDPEKSAFMPKPGEIIAQIANRRDPVLAWREVEEAMFECGAYETVCFHDQVTHAVIRDLGGWPWVCSQDLDEPWTQKEFERRYAACEREGVGLTDPLRGIHSSENLRKGEPGERNVRMIGGPAHGVLVERRLLPEARDKSPDVIRRLQEIAKEELKTG